ncbi:hydrogenase maturation protease [Thermocrinis albus DSM 14484]|uniref:Hydrogenase maturation protease n=1 Tax=Thermocrinis albus (strain DSM 14484 / JCM 11386 / HI 11/12) TaxID=638303 RepID=D3SMQ6_THEAH|nr:hydrogenase maturation protease [Thermocrinis albus]ADC90036.1 hydrogenase maturation protease [Thermocrinis albus DSM 14484]
MKRLVLVGCGNPLRGDDGVGPRLIRYMWEKGVPPGVKLVDGGTSGLDVIFHMEGAEEVILVDACYTGSEAGSIYCVPAEEVEELPDLREANLHSIKWFHALALAKEMMPPEKRPKRITVYLIEGKNFQLGEDLSEEVKRAMENLAQHLIEKFQLTTGEVYRVVLREDGYLVIPAEVAEKYFVRSMSVLVLPRGLEFLLVPLPNDRQGGLILKRINRKGDRAVLIYELLPAGIQYGSKVAQWSEEEGALVVSLI